jgi:hypothetical protein
LFLSLYFFGIFRDNFYTSEEIANLEGTPIYASNYFDDSYLIGIETFYLRSIQENFSVEIDSNLLKNTKYENCVLKGYGFGTCKNLKQFAEKSFIAGKFYSERVGTDTKITNLYNQLFS